MKRFLTILIPFFILLLLPRTASGKAAATVWTAETLPMVHLQDARRYVCNPEDLLSASAVDSADVVLGRLERERGVQTIVAVVRRIQGEAYDFGMALGRKYGVGSKTQRTGLIIVLATDDRKYYILTGNGLEGTLPDAVCARVERSVMVPRLKQGEWDAAIVGTVKALAAYIEGDETLRAELSDDDDAEAVLGIALLVGFALLVVLLIVLSHPRRNCPQCGRHTLVRQRQDYVRRGRKWKLRSTWQCSTCGHEEITEEDPPSGGGAAYGRSAFPPIYGGGLSSGSWGGGSFGGSFGGGSFGGGGAGGRF